MDNAVCTFDEVQNPNDIYDDTINLVFFKAVPLSKAWKQYTDGLKSWPSFKKQIFQDTNPTIQLFIDEDVYSDETIRPHIDKLHARVFVFKCPEFLLEDNVHHIGLFGTMIRFSPAFDTNIHPFTVAHIHEIEPPLTYIDEYRLFNKFSPKLKTSKTAICVMSLTQLKVESKNDVPWGVAGLLDFYKQIPVSLWIQYLQDRKDGKTFKNIYTSTRQQDDHGLFKFGVDETFLNNVCFPYFLEQGANILVFMCFSYHSVLDNRYRRLSLSDKTQKYIDEIYKTGGKTFTDLMRVLSREIDSNRYVYAKRLRTILERDTEWLGEFVTKYFLENIGSFFKRYAFVRYSKKEDPIIQFVDNIPFPTKKMTKKLKIRSTRGKSVRR